MVDLKNRDSLIDDVYNSDDDEAFVELYKKLEDEKYYDACTYLANLPEFLFKMIMTKGAVRAFEIADKEIIELQNELKFAAKEIVNIVAKNLNDNRWWGDKWDCYRKADLGRRNVIAKELDAKAKEVLEK